MTEEITIKELLEKAGVDADDERYQELASYIAAHGVYAVDLADDGSEAITSQTHIMCIPNAVKRKSNVLERKSNEIRGGISDGQNQNLPDFRFTRRCPGVIQRSQLCNESLSAWVDLHFEDGRRGSGLRSTGPRCLLHNA